MLNERREQLLKKVTEIRSKVQLSDYLFSRGEGYEGNECGHYGGNYWKRNTKTGEIIAVVPNLRPDRSRLGKLLHLEYRLLVEKTSGPEWERM